MVAVFCVFELVFGLLASLLYIVCTYPHFILLIIQSLFSFQRKKGITLCHLIFGFLAF